MAAETGSKTIPKISSNFDGAPKKAKGKNRRYRHWLSRYEQDLVGERGKGRQAMAVAGSVTSLRGLPYSVYYD